MKLLKLTVDGAEVVRLLKERGLHALIELLAALGSATAAPPRWNRPRSGKSHFD